MLDTFKVQLKAKSTAAGANLSQKRIDALADRLNAKFPDLSEEADHVAKIDDLYDADTLKDFAAVDDYQRAKEKREAEKKKEVVKDKDEKIPEKKDDEVPAWAQALIDQNKTLTDKINGIEKEKSFISIKSKISEGLKDVPEKIWSRMALPEKEEEVEGFITSVKQDWVDLGLASQSKPGGGGGGSGGGGGKAPSKAEVDAIVDKIKIV